MSDFRDDLRRKAALETQKRAEAKELYMKLAADGRNYWVSSEIHGRVEFVMPHKNLQAMKQYAIKVVNAWYEEEGEKSK